MPEGGKSCAWICAWLPLPRAHFAHSTPTQLPAPTLFHPLSYPTFSSTHPPLSPTRPPFPPTLRPGFAPPSPSSTSTPPPTALFPIPYSSRPHSSTTSSPTPPPLLLPPARCCRFAPPSPSSPSTPPPRCSRSRPNTSSSPCAWPTSPAGASFRTGRPRRRLSTTSSARHSRRTAATSPSGMIRGTRCSIESTTMWGHDGLFGDGLFRSRGVRQCATAAATPLDW